MLRGVYSSASGMMAGAHSQRVISDNVSNVNTNGHRAGRAVMSPFGAMFLKRTDSATHSGASPIGSTNAGARVAERYTNEAPGEIRHTGREGDLALEGSGYFVLEGQEGPLLSRDGEFMVDDDGYLVSAEGYRLRSDVGFIHVGDNSFDVDSDGTVNVNGDSVGQLEIAQPDTDQTELLEGGYVQLDDAALEPAEDTLVHQGQLESSNVDMVKELTLLMTAQRSYAANHTAMQVQDETLDEATRLSDGI